MVHKQSPPPPTKIPLRQQQKWNYSNPKSFVNLLLPPLGFGEGWGGVKNLRLLQELL